MKRKTILIAATAAAIVLLMTNKAKAFAKPTASGIIRACDAFGCGAFEASRTGHIHQGEDFEIVPGESIFSMFSGKVVRESLPYADDLNYRGVLIQNAEYEMKIFYMRVSVPLGSMIAKGQKIGVAQNIAAKYGNGMTPHVHVQIKDLKTGKFIKPSSLL